jgi:hypothetical protein
MDGDQWIVVCNWHKFQHYKTRDGEQITCPDWIKNYVRLLHEDAYLRLTLQQRGLLHGLWLEYAMSGTCLRLDLYLVNRSLNVSAKMSTLEALRDAGFIEFSSRPSLAQKRREEKRDKPNGLSPPTPRENPIWDVVSEIWGEPLSDARSKKARGKIVSDFRELLIRDGVQDAEQAKDEIRRRHAALAADWGNGKATARSLVNNWKVAGQLADGSGKLGLSAEDMARQAIEDHERGL